MGKILEINQNCWIVIPAFNEGKVICDVIQPLIQEGYQVVVVDDGSSDGSPEKVIDLDLHFCRHTINLGQGAALQTGIQLALKNNALYIVTFDGDGQHRAEDVKRLLEPLLTGRCQVTLASRFIKSGGATGIPFCRKLLLKSGAWFTRRVLGVQVTDVHNGLRGFTAGAALKIEITQNRMGHATQILSQIRHERLIYKEIPVTIRYTEYSLAKGQRLSNLLNVLWESAIEVFRR